MADVLRAELFKVVRRRMTYICIAVAVILVVIFYVVLWLRVRQGPDPGIGGYLDWLALRQGMAFANVVPYGFALERFFITLMCVIFAGTMMGNEFDWRTVGVVASRGVKRWQFLGAKFISGIIFTFLTAGICFLAAMAASAWFTNLYGLSYGAFDAARIGDGFASWIRTGFVALPFVLMSILLATFLRSAGQAVGGALGFYFIEGLFTSLLTNAHGWIRHIPEALFNINGDAIIHANGIVRGNDTGLFNAHPGVAVWQATVVLLAWMAVFLIGSFWRFHSRDLQE